MAAGHDLKEGQYVDRNLSEDELWSAFSYLFSSQSKNSTSYKFGFLKAILDNLYNVNENLVLTFVQLFSKFAESYWNLVLKYGIRQQPVIKGKNATALENVLYGAKERFGIHSMNLKANPVFTVENNSEKMLFMWIILYHGLLSRMTSYGTLCWPVLGAMNLRMISCRTRYTWNAS